MCSTSYPLFTVSNDSAMNLILSFHYSLATSHFFKPREGLAATVFTPQKCFAIASYFGLKDFTLTCCSPMADFHEKLDYQYSATIKPAATKFEVIAAKSVSFDCGTF